MPNGRPGSQYFGSPQQPRHAPPPTTGPSPGPGPTGPRGGAGSTWAASTTAAAAPSFSPPAQGQATSAHAIVDQAKKGDEQALRTLFGQFIPSAEPVDEAHYLGVMGMLGLGTHSFAALTPQRVATLRIGAFGEVFYQDAPLEYLNSTAVLQPSRLKLYALPAIWVFGWTIFLLMALVGLAEGLGGFGLLILLVVVLALLATPLVVKLAYGLVKSGMLLWVREGLAVFVFMDRQRITLANRYYRLLSELRDERVRAMGNP